MPGAAWLGGIRSLPPVQHQRNQYAANGVPRLMLTGKTLRLKSEIVGIESKDGDRNAVRVPANSTIEVTRGPTRKVDVRTIEVLWEGRAIVMLAEDIQQSCEEIPGDSDTA
jgi:hypothetical protein